MYAPGGVWQSPTGPVSVGGGGLTNSIYDTDPAVASAKAQEQLGIPKITSQLAALVAQRIANYGDPSIASMAGFGLDPQSAAFAQQNYLSGNAELARIDQTHKQNLQTVINQLAGHGLVFSGDTGYKTGLEDQNYGNTVYDAQQKALSDVLALIQSADTQKQQLENNLTSAYEGAYNTYTSNPAYYGLANAPVTPTSPTAPAATTVAPKAPAVSKPKASTGAKAAAKQLVNPYTTGQKKRG